MAMKMEEIGKCTIWRKEVDQYVIECKLGLWAVSGPDLVKTFGEAVHYFWKYREGGEYHEILGGPSPEDIFLNR